MSVVVTDKQVRGLVNEGKRALKKENYFEQHHAPITVDQLKGAVPKGRRHIVTQDLVDRINELIEDQDHRDVFRENLLSYTGVLTNPDITLTAYVQAVRYVSFKLMGFSNFESWCRTFPDRYKRLIEKPYTDGYIQSVVSQFNKGKTVNLVLEQSLVPMWVLNQDLYQKALNVQADLMLHAKSEKVRSDAANSLLTHLKQPETSKVSLDVTVKEDDSVRELRAATMELVRQQRRAIESGSSNAKEIAESRLLNGECERIN